MKEFIIFGVVVFFIVFLIIKHYRRQKKILDSEFEKALNLAKQKQEEFFKFIYLNLDKFYTEVDALKIKEFYVSLETLVNSLTELQKEYSPEKINLLVEQEIKKNKKQIIEEQGFYVDLFDTQELARKFLKSKLYFSFMKNHIELSNHYVNTQYFLFDQIFAKMLPDYKKDQALICECESLLESEFQLYLLSKNRNNLEILELSFLWVELILNSIESEKIQTLRSKFNAFLNRV